MTFIYVLCCIIVALMSGLVIRGPKTFYVLGLFFSMFLLTGIGEGPTGHKAPVPEGAYAVLLITMVICMCIAYAGRKRFIRLVEEMDK